MLLPVNRKFELQHLPTPKEKSCRNNNVKKELDIRRMSTTMFSDEQSMFYLWFADFFPLWNDVE